MDDYLTVEELINEAEKREFDFGKGDPYNRLRYYTKMGWIPHMIRKKEEDGSTKGHYPKSTIDRLLLIKKYKDEGMSNDDITGRLKARDRARGFYDVIGSEHTRNRIVIYGSFAMIVIILIAELGIIKVGQNKSTQFIIQGSQGDLQIQTQIISSGSAFIPRSEKTVFVMNSRTAGNSKIHVTFKEDYSPATIYWVSDQKQGKGFRVELDSPTLSSAEFDWWITN